MQKSSYGVIVEYQGSGDGGLGQDFRSRNIDMY